MIFRKKIDSTSIVTSFVIEYLVKHNLMTRFQQMKDNELMNNLSQFFKTRMDKQLHRGADWFEVKKAVLNYDCNSR